MSGSDSSGNAPAWLFSFVDLAFLLLIAMTQLAEDTDKKAPELGEIVVPRIHEEAAASLSAAAHERWQLRIHPADSRPTPFELVRATGSAEQSAAGRIDAEGLADALAELESQGERKPFLAPHEDSRSQDLLDAVAALEARWPGSRRAAVTPRLAQR
jgi:hypothetical protein